MRKEGIPSSRWGFRNNQIHFLLGNGARTRAESTKVSTSWSDQAIQDQCAAIGRKYRSEQALPPS